MKAWESTNGESIMKSAKIWSVAVLVVLASGCDDEFLKSMSNPPLQTPNSENDSSDQSDTNSPCGGPKHLGARPKFSTQHR